MTREPPQNTSHVSRVARKTWRRVRWRAHALLPRWIPHPKVPGLSHRHEEDQASNAATRVPDGEALHLRVLWAAEIFGPNEIERLYACLSKFDWSAGARFDTGGALGWVRRQRVYGFGGTYHVGYVTRRADRSRWIMARHNYAVLPESVDYLLVELAQLAPSVTCVLVGFVLKEDASQCFAQVANRDQVTAVVPREGGAVIEYLEPPTLKQRALERTRLAQRNWAVDWMHANLPGYFCARGDLAVMPTAELTTTDQQALFGDPNDRARLLRQDWRHVVARFGTVWTFRGEGGQSLRVSFSDSDTESAPFHLVASLCTSELEPGILQRMGWGDKAPASYVAYCHAQLKGILQNWAGLVFLIEAAKDIKLARQTMQVGKLSRRKTMQVLDRVQRFFDQAGSVSVAATEIRDRVQIGAVALPDCAHFEAPAWGRDGAPRILATELLARAGRQATEVVEIESALREHFTQLTSVVSIRESIAAQKKMEWLTYAAIFVALASLAVAVLSVQDWTPGLGWWHRLKSSVLEFGRGLLNR